jgi:pyruvate/oxaloacetate carboxyltransferase
MISLWIRRNVANGIKSFWICDYQDNMDRFRYFGRIAKAEGAEVVTSLMYSSSPVHTDELWAEKTQLIASAKECTDRIMIEDASGVITPEKTKRLVSIVERNCDGIPLEFHSHCNSGLAPLCYLEAIEAGITTVHTAVAPLANGTSLPSTESILKNIRHLGYASDLNEDALAAVSAHFREIAEREKRSIGVPTEYDLFHFEHQVPGGMRSNLTRQLKEVKMEHRVGEILGEVVQVRRELGYPVMATPFSQIVGTQAVENIVSGERYKHITDEVIKYALQYYGKPAGALDQALLDKIMDLPRTKDFLNWTPAGYLKSVEEFRQEVGPGLSDDDLLLKILIPGKPLPSKAPKKQVATVPATTPMNPSDATSALAGFPQHFAVEVDGEVFNIRILPGTDSTKPAAAGDRLKAQGDRKSVPAGAVLAGTPGLVLSIEVKVGDRVAAGDQVATVEAMKMRRMICSSLPGIVKQICAKEGDIVEAENVLMVVE